MIEEGNKGEKVEDKGMYSSFIVKKRVQYKRCRHIYQYISIGQLILIKDYSRSNLPE